jgi:hypothetical protein
MIIGSGETSGAFWNRRHKTVFFFITDATARRKEARVFVLGQPF